eukprot:TRINITY_DN16879_c0_g1_i1.p1 TRINITY_DN16879_c0_g1~~TRINITY_DN16879_c0_g1_i1.p1  ORF type:complete len:510 (-),score=109.64 TRINITY_DN16879_c0_g1_i1:22-1503(-)
MGATNTKDINDQTKVLSSHMQSDTGMMKMSDYKKLQKQIALEYPEVASVKESMLVADNRLPDCPLVYVNDQFERMTLYPKEMVLGKNCRFLQGAYSDKTVVKEIRQAVEAGSALDVELLNYRRDGVPFWNLFLMLPVHGWGKTKGKCNFFLAIQKDVSLIKGLTKTVDTWSSPEVCMWLERNHLGYAVERFLLDRVEGPDIFELTHFELSGLGFRVASDRQRILDATYKDFDADTHEYRYGIAVEKLDEWMLKYSEDDVRELLKTDQQVCRIMKEGEMTMQAVWGKDIDVVGQRIAVKCIYEGRNPRLILIKRPRSVRDIRKALAAELGREFGDMTVNNPTDNSTFKLVSDCDVSDALDISADHTVVITLGKPKRAPRRSAADALNCVPAVLLCIDRFEMVSFANSAAVSHFGVDCVDKPMSNFLPEICPNPHQEVHQMAGTSRTTRVTSAKTDMSTVVDCQLMGRGLAVLTIDVPVERKTLYSESGMVQADM